MEAAAFHAARPVNWLAPLASGLQVFYLAAPHPSNRTGWGGRYMLDLATNNHGPIVGGATWSGIDGTAVLNGSSGGYMSLAAAPILAGELTVTLRIKSPSTLASDGLLFRLNDGAVANAIWFYVGSGGEVKVDDWNSAGSGGGGGATAAGTIAVSTWYTLSYQVSNGTLSTWVDGTSRFSQGYTGGRDSGSQPHPLGINNNVAGGQSFNGLLKAFLIHNTAKDPALIHQEILAGFPTMLNRMKRPAFAAAAAVGGSVFTPYYYHEHIARMAG